MDVPTLTLPLCHFGCVAQLARLAIHVSLRVTAPCSLARRQWRSVRNRLTHSRDTGPPRSWHRLGPLDMPLEAKRFRHVAVAIPEVAVGGFVTTCPRQ